MNKPTNFKPVEDLVFSDDFMFGAIMRDEQTCKGVIERLLKIKIDHIEYPELQKSLNSVYDKKGVRFDVYVACSDKVFDVEIQSYTQKDIGKRMRYYQSMIDLDNLAKGHAYSELKESYILFLCLQDPFDAGLPVYTFNRTCKESSDIDLQDKTHHVIFNCDAFDKEEDAELKAFLEYVKSNRTESEFTRRIADMVQSKKFEQSFLNEYMAIKLHEFDVKERGRAEGFAKGEAKGIAIGMERGMAKGKTEKAIEVAQNLIKRGVPLEVVAESTGLSESYLSTLL